MNTRDYFAAHAPAVPDWFEYVDAVTLWTLPAVPTHWTPAQRKQWEGYGDYLEDKDCSPEVLAFAQEWTRLNDLIRVENPQLIRENADGRFFAWRYYYADRMMEEGNQPEPFL